MCISSTLNHSYETINIVARSLAFTCLVLGPAQRQGKRDHRLGQHRRRWRKGQQNVPDAFIKTELVM